MPVSERSLLSLKSVCEQLVLPHVLAVYEPIDDFRVRQIGTGIIVQHMARHFLITARHVLFGHSGKGPPADKAVFIGGRLQQIGDFKFPSVFSSRPFDIAAVELDGLGRGHGLPSVFLASSSQRPAAITICGYLARDFRRSTQRGALSPAPMIYTNLSAATPQGFIGLRYPRNRNRNSKTGQRVTVPIPRGLSGGAMLDTAALGLGQVRIVGIFTDKPPAKSIAFGEVSPKILALLQCVIEQQDQSSP